MNYRIIILAVFFSISSLIYAEPNIDVHQELLKSYKPEKVAEHTYVIHGPDRAGLKENQGFVNNPAFIITTNSVIVIDPGSSVQIGRAVLAHIRQLTKKPVTDIFITHIHGDHWLGNHAFKEENPKLKIYAHPKMIELANAGEAENWLDIFVNATDGAIKGTKIVLPFIALKDKQNIVIDNITVKAHLSKWAHTKTDVMFQVLEDKVLFTGDTVNNQRVVPFNDGSYQGSIDAISKAMLLDSTVVIPGHGAVFQADLLSDYKLALETIYDAVKNLMEEDFEPFEMKEKILKLETVFKNWSGFEDEVGRYISLAVLEIEREEF